MSFSESQDQAPRLPFLLRAFGFADEDALETGPGCSTSPCPITAEHYHAHSHFTTIELAELTSASIPTHYASIMSPSFPWDKIDTLVKEEHEGGEIVDWELEEWEVLYKLHTLFGSDYKAQEEDELAMREVMNDVLLWGLAVDSVTGEVEEMEGVLDGFGWEKCVLWFEDFGVPFGVRR